MFPLQIVFPQNNSKKRMLSYQAEKLLYLYSLWKLSWSYIGLFSPWCANAALFFKARITLVHFILIQLEPTVSENRAKSSCVFCPNLNSVVYWVFVLSAVVFEVTFISVLNSYRDTFVSWIVMQISFRSPVCDQTSVNYKTVSLKYLIFARQRADS